MNYKCIPCNTVCNGIIPYEAHMRSEKHKKKVENAKSMNVTDEVPKQSTFTSDPFIKQLHNEFKCTLCCAILNSLQQVQAHVDGKKHKSLAGKNIPQNSNSFSVNPKVNLSSFVFRDVKIENPLSNIKVFDVDEPIIF